MTMNPTELLKRLAPGAAHGVTPAVPARPVAGGPAGDLARLDFAGLLERARSGEIQSAAPVTVDRGLGLELSDEQLERIGRAADLAEAEGFAMAVVQLDGRSLVLDVASRRITGVLGPESPVAAGVDGVVLAPEAVGTGEATGAASREVGRATLLRRLERPGASGG